MTKTLVREHITTFQTLGLGVAREAENCCTRISIYRSWKWVAPSVSALTYLMKCTSKKAPPGSSIKQRCPHRLWL